MSRFSRAFEAAIKEAGLTRADAAAAAEIDASVLSRLLNDEREVTRDHVARLIAVLKHDSDREHCVREFLIDQTPPQLRERLVVHFGTMREAGQRAQDPLSRNLEALESAATDNPDLRKLVANLAALFPQR